MKTINKIALLASLIASAIAANASTATATLTINAANNSQCSVGFSSNTVTFKLARSGTGSYVLGNVTAGTSTDSNNATGSVGAPVGLPGANVGLLQYSCTQGSAAAITITTANNFKLLNLDSPSNYISYGMFLGAPSVSAQWTFDNNIVADATNIASSALAGKSVIQTVGNGSALDGTLSTSQVRIVADGSSNATAPGQYQDIVTATMLY